MISHYYNILLVLNTSAECNTVVHSDLTFGGRWEYSEPAEFILDFFPLDLFVGDGPLKAQMTFMPQEKKRRKKRLSQP